VSGAKCFSLVSAVTCLTRSFSEWFDMLWLSECVRHAVSTALVSAATCLSSVAAGALVSALTNATCFSQQCDMLQFCCSGRFSECVDKCDML
jgi:hypothetical protein